MMPPLRLHKVQNFHVYEEFFAATREIIQDEKANLLVLTTVLSLRWFGIITI
jgi:hypothetical protein